MSNMSECHLDKKTEDAFGYRIYRVTNDVNGNPRYVTTWMAFSDDYQSALKIARSEGFRVYRGKDFGGGFVAQSYNLESTVEGIIAIRKKEEIAKELGDVLWYMANLAFELGYDLGDIAAINIQKLVDRQERGKIHGDGDNR